MGVYYHHWTVCHLFLLYVMISAEPSKFLSCSFNLILDVNIDQLLINLLDRTIFEAYSECGQTVFIHPAEEWKNEKKIIFEIRYIPLAYNGFDFSYNLKIIKYIKDACTVTYHFDRHLSIKHPFWKLFCRKIHFPGLWLALPIAYKLSN